MDPSPAPVLPAGRICRLARPDQPDDAAADRTDQQEVDLLESFPGSAGLHLPERSPDGGLFLAHLLIPPTAALYVDWQLRSADIRLLSHAMYMAGEVMLVEQRSIAASALTAQM